MNTYFPSPGGILLPQDLKNLIWKLKAKKVSQVHLGMRQNLWWDSQESENYHPKDVPSQTISSLWLWDVVKGTSWYNPGVIFEIIHHLPELPPGFIVEILDSAHSVFHPIPGTLRFQTWEQSQVWTLEICLGEEIWLWPHKVLTGDLGPLVETLILQFPSTTGVDFERNLGFCVNKKPLGTGKFPEAGLWEGWSGTSTRHRNLHLRRSSGTYTLDFLMDVASLAEKQNLPRLALSPWGGLTLSGITNENVGKWNQLLKIHNLSLRSGAEKWCLFPMEDSQELINLKCDLESRLSQIERRTEEQIFLIRREQTLLTAPRNFPHLILREDETGLLSPPHGNPQLFQSWEEIPDLLFPLSSETPLTPVSSPPIEVKKCWKCPDCLNVYDPTLGEKVDFWSLPTSYECQVCGAPKSTFIPMLGIQDT